MSLEDRYRRLLRAYPRSYRARRGEEMLSTLLDSAAPRQTHPSRGDASDLLMGAIRERLGLHAVPGFAAGLRVAGPVCLAFAAAFTASNWIAGHRNTASTVVAVAWLLAALAHTVGGQRARGLTAFTTGAAWLSTLGVSVVAITTPPLIIDTDGFSSTVHLYGEYVVALMFGLIAALATAAPQTSSGTLRTVDRAGVAVAVISAVAAVALVESATYRVAFNDLVFTTPVWATWWLLAPVTALIVGVVRAVTRRATGGLWATGLLLVPLPMIGLDSFDLLGSWHLPSWSLPTQAPSASLSVMLGAVVALAVLIGATRAATPAPTRDSRMGLAIAGSVGLDLAAALNASIFAISTANNDGPTMGTGWTAP
ncbi:hypothetical protein ACFQX7_16790 [Luedemannella flava]